MKKLQFKGKEFKGSTDEFKLKPCANGGVILELEKNQSLQIRSVPNARLLCNSKKLLEAAIDTCFAINKLVEMGILDKEHKIFTEQLEQAILDSL